jgi:hypothetical protein
MSNCVIFIVKHTWIEVILVLISRRFALRGGPWNGTPRNLLNWLRLRLLHNDDFLVLVLKVSASLLESLLSLKFVFLQRGSLGLNLNRFIEKATH